MLGLEKIPQQRHNQKNIQINQYKNSIFILPNKMKKYRERKIKWKTYGIQRGKKLTKRLQKGCKTYLAKYELSTPLYLYLCNAATPWAPMYPILSPFFFLMIYFLWLSLILTCWSLMEKLFDINQHKYTRLNDESPKIMHFNYSEFQPKKK